LRISSGGKTEVVSALDRLRFLSVLWLTKAVFRLLRLLGRNATQLPGRVAIALCPAFLARLGKPTRIVAVTGTNGKTTTANMITDALRLLGCHVTSNSAGSNLNYGVASALLRDATLTGRAKNDYGVFEIDEISVAKVLGSLDADVLVITNLFRDSIYRNAHPAYIAALLEAALPHDTTLVLNADDVLVSELGKLVSKRVFFSVARLPDEQDSEPNLVIDARTCPVCDAQLVFDFRRYHHIGRVHCPVCGYHSPDADYLVTSISDAQLSVKMGNENVFYPLAESSLTNVYNQVSAVAALSEFGVSQADLVRAFAHVQVSSARLEAVEVAGKRIVTRAAKGLNPVAVSRAFADVAATPGRKAVIACLDDVFDATSSTENISWLYDTDFELLADEGVSQVIIGGKRHLDYRLRLLLAGVPAERIATVPTPGATADVVDLDGCDTVFVLNDVYTLEPARTTVARLRERLA
jgi:UDP-N-acetylmuramyl tripeptide synthase